MDLRHRHHTSVQGGHIARQDRLDLPNQSRRNDHGVFGLMGHRGVTAHTFDMHIKE